MRVKTVIRERMGRRRVKERSILIATFIHLLNIVFGVILPFVMGFYFARSENLFFFLFLVLAIFFEIRLEYKGDTVKFKILRLL